MKRLPSLGLTNVNAVLSSWCKRNTRSGSYNYTVDCGDGMITSCHTGNAIHTYATPGN